MESEGDQGNVGNVCGWMKSFCKVRGVSGMYVGRCKVFGEVGNARGIYGVDAKCQGNPRGFNLLGGYQVFGDARGMLGECMGVDAFCLGTPGECQGNVWGWVQSARGM